MLAACDRAKPYARPGKRSCDIRRPAVLLCRAIVLQLLDTGMRAADPLFLSGPWTCRVFVSRQTGPLRS
jgi:hypothetical protein